jgi:hypothetical protein
VPWPRRPCRRRGGVGRDRYKHLPKALCSRRSLVLAAHLGCLGRHPSARHAQIPCDGKPCGGEWDWRRVSAKRLQSILICQSLGKMPAALSTNGATERRPSFTLIDSSARTWRSRPAACVIAAAPKLARAILGLRIGARTGSNVSRSAVSNRYVNRNHPRARRPSDIANVSGTGGVKSRPHHLRFFPQKNWKRARLPTSRHPGEPHRDGLSIATRLPLVPYHRAHTPNGPSGGCRSAEILLSRMPKGAFTCRDSRWSQAVGT